MESTLIAYGVVVFIQLIFYLFIFLKFGFHKPTRPSTKKIGISVIICAKNEAHNLKRFIPHIIQQNYPEFELVLVNDGSSDDSLEIMQMFASNHKNVKLVDVKPIETFWNNKKYPLTLGIKAATNDYLLFTDADCVPESNNWITEMSRYFSNEKTIVLGYGAYRKKPWSLLNKLIRFETVLTAMQYFSYALLGRPYMGVGRNLAYRKDLFFSVSGFKDHLHVRSGDDDLFINQIATSTNTAISVHPDSFTTSLAQSTFAGWFNQKRRHVSASFHYKATDKLILGLFYTSQLAFWISTILLISLGVDIKWVLSLFLLRTIALYLSYILSTKTLKETDLLLLLPLLDLFLVLTQLVIFISNLTTKSRRWR